MPNCLNKAHCYPALTNEDSCWALAKHIFAQQRSFEVSRAGSRAGSVASCGAVSGVSSAAVSAGFGRESSIAGSHRSRRKFRDFRTSFRCKFRSSGLSFGLPCSHGARCQVNIEPFCQPVMLTCKHCHSDVQTCFHADNAAALLRRYANTVCCI